MEEGKKGSDSEEEEDVDEATAREEMKDLINDEDEETQVYSILMCFIFILESTIYY